MHMYCVEPALVNKWYRHKKLSFFFCSQGEEVEEEIDWWSKYYASVGELDKCRQYLEQGYDKLQVNLW